MQVRGGVGVAALDVHGVGAQLWPGFSWGTFPTTSCLWQGVIVGQPVSGKNRRRLVFNGGRPRFIQSVAALDYGRAVALQVPRLPELLTGDLVFVAVLAYRSRRSDLDEALLLDALQGRVYGNDRQVRERHVLHQLDAASPRAWVGIWPQSRT